MPDAAIPVTVVSTTTATDANGRQVEALPVRVSEIATTDAAGNPVAPVPMVEAAGGMPVRIVEGKSAQNSIGQWLDVLAVSGLSSASLSAIMSALGSDQGMNIWFDTAEAFIKDSISTVELRPAGPGTSASTGTGTAVDDGTTVTLNGTSSGNRGIIGWAVTGLEIGREYKFTAIVSGTTGNLALGVGATISTALAAGAVTMTGPGTWTGSYIAAATSRFLILYTGTSGAVATIPNASVSIKAVNTSTAGVVTPDDIPGLTYTNPSPKMITGPDGVSQYAPHNLISPSDDLTNASWVKSGVGVAKVTDLTLGLVDEITDDNTSVGHIVSKSAVYSSDGLPFGLRFRIKGETAGFAVIGTRGNSISTHVCKLNFATGEISSKSGIFALSTTSTIADPLPGGWWQITLLLGAGSNSSAGTGITIGITDSVDPRDVYAGTGKKIRVTNVQAFVGARVPVAYVPTTSAARCLLPLDHDPATLDTSATANTVGSGGRTFYTSGAKDYRNASQAWADATAYVTGDKRYTAAGRSYTCGISHTSSALTEPGVGSLWSFYWKRTERTLRVSDQADSSNYFIGTVESYQPGVLTLAPIATGGSGTKSAWNIIEPLGVLVEEARTNLAFPSNDFTHANWVKSAKGGGPPLPVVTAAAAMGPDGVAGSASRIDFPAVSVAGDWSEIARVVAGANGPYDGSIHLKGVVGGEQLYLMWTNGVAWFRTLCTLSATEWRRFEVATTASGGAWYFQIGVDLRDSGQTAKPAQSVYMYGGQYEQAPFATSYIPTGATAATRNADVISIATTAFPFSATEGEISFKGKFPSLSGFRYLWMLSGASETIVNYLDFHTPTYRGTTTGAVTQWAMTFGTVAAGAELSTASAWKANDVVMSVNGGAVANDNSAVVPTTTALYIGCTNAGVTQFNGHIKRLEYRARRPSDHDVRLLAGAVLADRTEPLLAFDGTPVLADNGEPVMAGWYDYL